jgi:CBS domain-containing protein
MKHRSIDHLMTPTRHVVSVLADTPYKTVAELLDRHRIGAVPVIDGDRRVLGVVSETDLLVKESAAAESHVSGQHLFAGPAERRAEAKAAGTTAGELMTAPAVTICPQATVAEAARRMSERHVKHLIVTDSEGRLEGIISRGDLLAVFVRPDAEILREISQDVVLGVFWIDPATLYITVDDGIVHLAGQVETLGLAWRIGEVVGRADGVVSVVNDLEYDRDDTKDRPPHSGPYGLFENRTP